jgi:hypothetical protein
MYTRKKRRIIKPRFYVICTLLIAGITMAVIFTLAKGLENIETFKETPTPTLLSVEKDIPEVPVVLEEEVQLRYGFTDGEIYLLAQVLSGGGNVDGDGEYDIDFREEINYYEVGKVLGVIMNRVRSNDFPDTVTDVVKQKGQFSVIPRNLTREPSDIALSTVREWCTAYDNYINLVQVVPKNHLFFTGNGTINTTRAKHK